jgi:hypothetical protein
MSWAKTIIRNEKTKREPLPPIIRFVVGWFLNIIMMNDAMVNAVKVIDMHLPASCLLLVFEGGS